MLPPPMMPQILFRRAPNPTFEHSRIVRNDTIDVRFQERGGPELVKGGAAQKRGEREAVRSGEEGAQE